MSKTWQVLVRKKAQEKINAFPPRVLKKWLRLLKYLQDSGPILPLESGFKNFGKLKRNKKQAKNEERWHCHIHSGQPTFVVCWRQDTTIETAKIEVYDANTHEKIKYGKDWPNIQ